MQSGLVEQARIDHRVRQADVEQELTVDERVPGR